MKTLKRLAVWAYGLIRFVNTALLCAVLYFASSFFGNIAIRYENTYTQMTREHDRQMVVNECLLSQQAWERTADFMREQLLVTQAEKNSAQLHLEVMKSETYHLLRTLQSIDPQAYTDVMDALAPHVEEFQWDEDMYYNSDEEYEPTPELEDNTA